MRYRSFIFLVALSLAACTFQVQVVTPEPVAIQSAEVPTSTPLPPPTIPAVLPTYTATAVPQSGGVYPIHFSPNGTFVDVTDSIAAGGSKTYSVAASKGQVMSISVKQSFEGEWTYIPMQITGADGTVLCPPSENTECEFWRGVLPATQEYFIKVLPVNDLNNFTLRIVIPPLGASQQTFLFQNATAALTYTDDFAPVRFPGPMLYKVEPELVLEFIDSPFYVKTNLVEAYLLFGATNEAGTVASCTQPASLGGPETVIGDVTVNGNTFVRSEGAGLGAGNIYEEIYHRAVIKGACYEATFFLHYANIGNYAPELGIHEFDRDALLQRFESILSTLVIK